MLSPLGRSGSGVGNLKGKQTGTPVPMGIGMGGAGENGRGVGLTCWGKGGVAPWGNPWYVVWTTCGWFVSPTSMTVSAPVMPGCSETLVSVARSELGINWPISTTRGVCKGSAGCKTPLSVEVWGSSGFGRTEELSVLGEGSGSAEGSRVAASVGSASSASSASSPELDAFISVTSGCRGSCAGSAWVAVSSDDLASTDSSLEFSPSVRQT